MGKSARVLCPGSPGGCRRHRHFWRWDPPSRPGLTYPWGSLPGPDRGRAGRFDKIAVIGPWPDCTLSGDALHSFGFGAALFRETHRYIWRGRRQARRGSRYPWRCELERPAWFSLLAGRDTFGGMVSDWVIDTEGQAVIHKETGLIVRFRRAGPGAWDGEAENQDVLLPQLASFGSQWVARLMRQAGDVFALTLKRYPGRKSSRRFCTETNAGVSPA